MREATNFNMFGVNYRARHFAAYGAVGMFGRLDEIDPTELLALTEVKDGEEWHSLGTPQNIDRFVRDVCGEVRPHEALEALMSLVKQYNFGFKVPKYRVPHRFRSKVAPHDDPDGTHPVLAWLFVEGKATWRELQEDYSLEDAFKMHHQLLVSKVKAAEEAEQAQKDAKSKARGG
ncbi:hypothetical protein AB4Y32_15310 [Paraburkholderia phymatum]|uniref:Uncharacterized protein n=1 Tax=Paraburkholderia phymatum TaxID=148447 RepID=A0ACC6U0K2_9BURK